MNQNYHNCISFLIIKNIVNIRYTDNEMDCHDVL